MNQEFEAFEECGRQEEMQHCTETSYPDNIFSLLTAVGMQKALGAQFNNILTKLQSTSTSQLSHEQIQL